VDEDGRAKRVGTKPGFIKNLSNPRLTHNKKIHLRGLDRPSFITHWGSPMARPGLRVVGTDREADALRPRFVVGPRGGRVVPTLNPLGLGGNFRLEAKPGRGSDRLPTTKGLEAGGGRPKKKPGCDSHGANSCRTSDTSEPGPGTLFWEPPLARGGGHQKNPKALKFLPDWRGRCW